MMRKEFRIPDVPDVVVRKLTKLKDDQGCGEMTWGQWFAHLTKDVYLTDTASELIQKHTREGLLEIWIQNLAKNLPRIWEGKSIKSIVPAETAKLDAEGKDPDKPTGTAVVVGRGPSLFEKKHLQMLAESDYRGNVVCTDGAMIEALKAGVKPENYENFFSVTVDGNPELIQKWYDHELVKEHGKHIKAVLCSSVAPNVPEVCEKNGVDIYYFHPLFDDYRNIESYTKIEQFMTKCEKHPNGLPAMQAGGHAGATAWVLSWVVLRKSPIALIGLNLGYTPETPLESTYYWKGLMEATRGNMVLMQQAYTRIHNPDFNCDCILDPVFAHYREAFIDLVKATPKWTATWNCTEGGSLFSEEIKCAPFKEFLEAFKK